MKEDELIFVYNANSDLFSIVSDFTHKILSPATYNCNLCALTYGNFTIKKDWKSFIENLLIKPIFLHKDEFVKKYKIEPALPAVFMIKNGDIKEIISNHEIEICQSLEELKKIVKNKIEEYVQHHNSNI